jgi:hypothetical protein
VTTPAPGPGPIAIQPAANPTTGVLTVNVFDGTRQLMKPGTSILLTVCDGANNELFRDFVKGPSIRLNLPFHDNFADNYGIVAFADGYQQAGFRPVPVTPRSPAQLDLMLLAKNGTFKFAHAQWADILQRKPLVAQIFSQSTTGAPNDAYTDIMESHPEHLACLLNITTAMQQIALPVGTPLDYFKTFDLPALAPDRIFGYADAKLVDQVRLGAQHGEFDTEPAIDLKLHGDATSSYKQIQFGEANVQLTFHEKNRKTIDGVDCVYVEPDIDYYKDLAAHALLEVIPSAITGDVSDPKVDYVLRWIAGRHAGVPEFDPLYTIE